MCPCWNRWIVLVLTAYLHCSLFEISVVERLVHMFPAQLSSQALFQYGTSSNKVESTMDIWALHLHSTEAQSNVLKPFLRQELELAVSTAHNAGSTLSCVKYGRRYWILSIWNFCDLWREVVLVVSTQTWKRVLNPFYWDVWCCLHNGRHSWSRLWRHQPLVSDAGLSALLLYLQSNPNIKGLFEFKMDTGMWYEFDINIPLICFETYQTASCSLL